MSTPCECSHGPHDGRPPSIAEMLEEIAKYLEISDRLIRGVAMEKDWPYDPGTEMQDDLRLMVAWFVAHPEVADQVWTETFEAT